MIVDSRVKSVVRTRVGFGGTVELSFGGLLFKSFIDVIIFTLGNKLIK